MDVFERYAPFVQDFIYRNGWHSLRGVQVAAGDAIFKRKTRPPASAPFTSARSRR